MLSVSDLKILEPEQLWQEFSVEEQTEAWQQSQQQAYSNDAARWRAYQNYLCLKKFEAWLTTEADVQDRPKVWPEPRELSSFWELVNGSAIALGKMRLLLVPDEALNLQELCVPQEWVDIPEWAADYYLAIQQNLEERWFRVVGYATHDQLKHEENYDPMDGTYCLGREKLIQDLNVIWLTRELSPSRELVVEALRDLPEAKAVSLLNQLSQPSLYSPRLDVPFVEWGALIANPRWRQQLYQRRTGEVQESASATVSKRWRKLSEWAQEALAAGGQVIDELTAFPNFAAATARGVTETKFEETITLGESVVELVVTYESNAEQECRVRIKVQPTDGQTTLPPNLQLSVTAVDEEKTHREEVKASDTSPAIELPPLIFSQGEQFTVEVTLEGFKFEKNLEADVSP
ncbi:MAG: DUF1822 family protein [Symploca sp. SIO1B1]|nr:DUF1822 family protein [Symploca sp. SIO1B1]